MHLLRKFLFGLLTVLIFQKDGGGGQADKIDVIIDKGVDKIEHIRKHVMGLFHKLGHDPNSTILHSLFPNYVALIQKEILQVENCYNSTINRRNVSIFHHPLGDVVHQYLKLLGHYDKVDRRRRSMQRVLEAVSNLLRTIKVVARVVIDCVKRSTHPDYEPTKISLNWMSSWSKEDLARLRMKKLGRKRGEQLEDYMVVENDAFDISDLEDKYVPEKFDYRNLGVVSHVKNQGATGTCFIFGPMAAIESSYMLQANKRGIAFSEHDILNCLVANGFKGNPFRGGPPDSTFKIAARHGLMLESVGEPFLPPGVPDERAQPKIRPEACKELNSTTKIATVKGFAQWSDVPDEMTLKKVIFKYGPVVTAFRSPHKNPLLTMWNGLNGKMHFSCDETDKISHSMAIVGWDKKYFIIKNSYGNQDDPKLMWGESGYLYLKRQHLKACGVIGPGSEILFPNVAKP